MFYKGELANFFPPDLLVFLAASEKEGFLTVKHPDPLTIVLKDGAISDAFSARSDATFLRILFHQKFISQAQLLAIIKAQKETSLSYRRLLRETKYVQMEDMQPLLYQSMEDVILQFFLRKSGKFQFTATTVPDNIVNTILHIDDVADYLSGKMDDWREYCSGLGNLNQVICRADSAGPDEAFSEAEELVLKQVNGEKTIKRVIAQTPVSDFFALKAIVHSVRKGALYLTKPSKNLKPQEILEEKPTLFLDYRKCFRTVLNAETLPKKIEEVLHFCRNYFDTTLTLSVQGNTLSRCLSFEKTNLGALSGKHIACNNLTIKDDRALTTVCTKGMTFFGYMYDSPFFKTLLARELTGECGIIPIEVRPDGAILIFVQKQKTNEQEISPLQYMELLSWLISPDRSKETLPEDLGLAKAQKLITLIDELPPMPNIAGKAMELLSNPNSTYDELVAVLEQDPSLLSMIIKVSNSALYSSGQTISTLSAAVAKLGLKMIHSLILTTATKSFFPEDDNQTVKLSQQLWHHSKSCALASRIIAKAVNYSDPEEAYVGGLIHDIGRLAILISHPEVCERISMSTSYSNSSNTTIEYKTLGFDHTQLGQMLVEKWQMPKILQACVENHHNPMATSSTYRPLAMIVSLANTLAHDARDENDETMSLSTILQELGLDDTALSAIKEEIAQNLKHVDDMDG